MADARDILNNIINDDNIDLESNFDDLVRDKIEDLMDSRKQEIASEFDGEENDNA